MTYSHDLIWCICTRHTVMLRLGYQHILEISEWICYLCRPSLWHIFHLSQHFPPHYLTFISFSPMFYILPYVFQPLWWTSTPYLIFWLNLTSHSFLLFLLSFSLDHTPGTQEIKKDIVIELYMTNSSAKLETSYRSWPAYQLHHPQNWLVPQPLTSLWHLATQVLVSITGFFNFLFFNELISMIPIFHFRLHTPKQQNI